MGAAGLGGSFAPIVQYEKGEIHKVFPHFPYFRLGQNLTPNRLAPLCGVALSECCQQYKEQAGCVAPGLKHIKVSGSIEARGGD